MLRACLLLLITFVAAHPASGQTRIKRHAPSEPATAAIEGLTEPFRRVDIAAAESGLIMGIEVQDGAVVKQGQILARLDDLVLQATLAVAKAQKEATGQLRVAEAELRLRTSRWQKLEDLLSKGHATPQEVALARSDMEVAQARVQQASEALRVKELEYARTQAQIERRLIRSPIDGVVTEVYREPWEFVSYTDPVVATIVQLDPLLAVFTVYPHQVKGLKSGDPVNVTLASSQTTARGQVTYMSPVLDAESGTMRIKVRISNGHGRYRAGDKCTLQTGLPTDSTARVSNKSRTTPSSR